MLAIEKIRFRFKCSCAPETWHQILYNKNDDIFYIVCVDCNFSVWVGEDVIILILKQVIEFEKELLTWL